MHGWGESGSARCSRRARSLGAWIAVCALGAGCSAYKSSLLAKPSHDAAVSEGDGAVAGGDAAEADAGIDAGGALDGGPADSGATESGPTDSGSTNPPPDAGSCAAGQCWWSQTSGECASAGVPTREDRPASSGDVENQDVDPIYLGWTHVRLGSTEPDGTATDTAWEGFGLDLDGVCTNSSTCPSMQGVVSCKSAGMQIPFDGELCRDNTFASLQPVTARVPEIGQQFGLSEDVFNCALWRGSYNIIIRISGYNGQPDDPHVRVDYYISDGLEQSQAWQCPLDGYSDMYPLWRASSPWHIDSSGLSGPVDTPGQLPDSLISDSDAYVRSGYLVSFVPDGTVLRLAGDGMPYRGFPLKSYSGIWVGNLEQGQDQIWRIHDGLAVGRTRSDDLIESFRQIGFCEGMGFDSFYQSMVQYVQENADILASGEPNPDTPCDAMSFGIAFEASQLTPGDAGPILPLFECCAPGKTVQECSAVCGDGTVSGDEMCDTAISAGQPGACPSSCAPIDHCNPQALVGSGCDAHCEPMPVTAFVSGDLCCPPGGNAANDSDCVAMCGNDVVEPGETCDPSSSCPVCSSSNPCLTAVTTGTPQTCDVACSLMPVTACAGGDQCCPEGCTYSNDADCPMGCGDGVLDPSAGETCEAGTSTPCPTSCDDGDSCTSDQQTGSAANCNVVCTHTPVTQLQNGDGCCPAVANANNNTDSDCAPVCGNGVVEGSEQCDDGNQTAGDGCAGCMIETPQQICVVKTGVDDACSECGCANCLNESNACFGASSSKDVMLCKALIDCGRAHSCLGNDCYCGTADLFSCLLGFGDGPCRAQVEAAAKTTDPATISTRSSDTNYPVGRANALGSCASTSCGSECGL